MQNLNLEAFYRLFDVKKLRRYPCKKPANRKAHLNGSSFKKQEFVTGQSLENADQSGTRTVLKLKKVYEHVCKNENMKFS